MKDRKILYELDLDSRQSFSQLGRKIGLRKDLVAYRVKKLMENKLIFNFYTYIDLSSLGYDILRFYFKFQYTSVEMRKKIIQEIVNMKCSLFVNSTDGEVELSAYFAVKNIYEFQKIWDNFYREYGDYFANISFSIWCCNTMYSYSFLLDEDQAVRTDKKNVTIFGDSKKVDIDELDFQILKNISTDSRIPSLDLAKKLNVTVNTVTSRISHLQKNGIIKAYRLDIAFSGLDYKIYRLDIYLKNHKMRHKINDFITDSPLIYSSYISLGDAADLEYEIFLKNLNQLHQIIESVTMKFPDCIKNYRYYTIIEKHKNTYIPD